jgi:hypothetical protein
MTVATANLGLPTSVNSNELETAPIARRHYVLCIMPQLNHPQLTILQDLVDIGGGSPVTEP